MELQHRDQGLCELTPVSTPTLAANSRFEEVPLHAEHPPKFPTRPLSGVAQLS
jgi:hypothetical protein